MRLVVWNCAMALHRKWSGLESLRPDIAVVPECAGPRVLERKCAEYGPSSSVWVGSNENKGLGIFAFGDYRVQMSGPPDETRRFVPLLNVSGPRSFRLLAVWAFNRGKHFNRRTGGPVSRALRDYGDQLAAGPVVVAGDFNNNVIWDRGGKATNHALVVAELEALGLLSAYHHSRGEAQGAESTPTHYWQTRAKDGRTYHLDFVFAPSHWLEAASVTVGSFDEWVGSGMSDHVPIVVEFPPL